MEHELRDLLKVQWPEGAAFHGRVVEFWKLLVLGNQQQNLTKLISPEAFYFGHVVDVQKLLLFSAIEYPAVDLGSGCGVPGLLAAALSTERWILVESEGKKADFLRDTVHAMGLQDRVQVINARVENWLKNAVRSQVKSIVARAVGPISRIYGWIGACSTWNNLILFKGPSWEEEWKNFDASALGSELKLGPATHYDVGPERKTRIIIRIDRVPRGTV